MALKAIPLKHSSKQSFTEVYLKKYLSRSPLRSSGQLFPIKWLSISFLVRSSIKLVIINTTYTYKESYPLSYYPKQVIKMLSSCLQKLDGCFFLKYGFRSDCPEILKRNTSVGWKCSYPLNDSGQLVADLLFLILIRYITSDGFYWEGLVDLVRVYSLHIISRNHSNTFLLINSQKTKTCPK